MNNVYLDRTLYFDNIVSMRVTKSLDDESKFEDITKRVWTSSHDIKKSITNKATTYHHDKLTSFNIFKIPRTKAVVFINPIPFSFV